MASSPLIIAQNIFSLLTYLCMAGISLYVLYTLRREKKEKNV